MYERATEKEDQDRGVPRGSGTVLGGWSDCQRIEALP